MQMENELFWKLLEPVHAEASGFCRKLAGDSDLGDDLYQDGLVRALAKFGQLRSHDAFRNWLYRILINTHRNSCRSAWWCRRVRLTPEITDNQVGDDPSVGHARRRLLNYALAGLCSQDRALVILHELQGWRVEELAETTGRPVGTIKTRLHRARLKMRQRLQSRHRQTAGNTKSEAEYALPRCKTSDG